MTDNNHPITPPPEMVEQWASLTQLGILADIFSNTERPDKISVTLAKTTRDLIVEYRDLDDEWFKELSAALEPKPPSLKEQALEQLKSLEVTFLISHGANANTENIRRALEALPE